MLKLDDTDRQLLQILQADARISNVELAERLNLSPTPCLRRLRKLESLGVIKGYKAQLDPEMLGITVTALAFIKLARNNITLADEFEKQVLSLPAVLECSVVTGAYDYVLRIVAKSLEDYEFILKNQLGAIEPVADVESTIVLKQVNLPGVLPL